MTVEKWSLQRLLSRNRSFTIGSIIVMLVVISAVFAPLLSTHDPLAMDLANQLRSPGRGHLCGTDAFGRDVFSRVIYGSRISLIVGSLTSICTGVIGVLVGFLAGFYRRWDNLIMRIMDAQMALPAILLAITLMAILGPSITNTIVALSIVYLPRTARIVRGSILSLKEKAYVESARAVGSSDWRIFFTALLPNSMAPLVVQQTVIIAYAILSEAALSFLGVGAPPPAPSWGNIMSEARDVIRTAPWVSLFPGLAVMTTVIGLNLMGDGLRDILDPIIRDSLRSNN